MKRVRAGLCVFIPLILALILESRPDGVVLYDLNMNDPDFKSTVSYFSLVPPFGGFNFGPILTVILTFVLLVLSIVYVVCLRENIRKLIFWLSIAAVVTSLLPLLFGLRWFTVLNAAVTALMLFEAVITWLLRLPGKPVEPVQS